MDFIITAFIVIFIGSIFVAFFLPSIVALLVATMKLLCVVTLYSLKIICWVLKALVFMISFPFIAIWQVFKKDSSEQPRQ